MTKNSDIKKAIEIVRKYARERYGWEAKFHPDKMEKWNELMQVIKTLEGLKDERTK